MPDVTKIARLISLLQKIEQQKRHIAVSIDWDGKRFRWRATIGGLAAEEWSPSQNLPPCEMTGDEIDSGVRNC
jgi:hypothetical protein